MKIINRIAKPEASNVVIHYSYFEVDEDDFLIGKTRDFSDDITLLEEEE